MKETIEEMNLKMDKIVEDMKNVIKKYISNIIYIFIIIIARNC